MLIAQAIDDIQRSIGGGETNLDSKLLKPYIENKIHDWRASAIKSIWDKQRRINPAWLQTSLLVYNSAIQDASQPGKTICYIKFAHPDIISLNNFEDGGRYFGDITGDNSFTRIIDPETGSTTFKHRITSIKNSPFLRWELVEQVSKVYGDMQLRKCLAIQVFSNPLDVQVKVPASWTARAFNAASDPYPISRDVLNVMKQLAREELLNIQKQPQDLLNNAMPATP